MDNQTRSKMIKARQYIKRKDYNNARYILLDVDHPTADKWLQKLNRIDPSYSESNIDVKMWLAFLIIGMCCIVGLYLIMPDRQYYPMAVLLSVILGLILYSVSSRYRYKRQ